MPIESITRYTGERPQAEPKVTSSIDTYTAVTDFLKTENGLYNLADGMSSLIFNKFEPDPEYVSEMDMDGYEGYAENLRGARNSEEMAFLKNKIDTENQRRESFAMADGWQKAAGIGALIVTDPLTLVPIGGTAYNAYRKTGRILEGAAKTAGVAAAMEIGNETLLQVNQITRTGEESLYNVAATTVLGGMLGGAAGALSKVEYEDLLKKFEKDMEVPTEDRLSSVGAMQNATTFEEEEIAGLTRLKKVYSKMPSFAKNPVLNTALSESRTVRVLSETLSDLSLAKNKNAAFKASEASVESLIKGYDALRVPFYAAEKKLWKQYQERIKKEGVPLDQKLGSRKDGSLTRQEFNEQVWYAGINKDTHIVPEVAEYAKTVRREVYDPVLKRSEEVGIFQNIDEMDVKTAASWMKRMPDRDKIINNRTEFKKIVVDDLAEARARSIDELEELKKAEQTDEIIKQIKKLEFKASQIDAELDDIAEQLIDRITNSTAGRLPYDLKVEGRSKGKMKAGLRGSAKARVWNIKDEKIADYLVKDVRAITESHLRTMAPDNELMGKFGTLDFDVVRKQVQEDYNTLRSSKVKDKKTGEMRPRSNSELAKLDKQMKQDIRDLEAMHEKLRGTYAQPDDYAAPQHVLERTALGWNFVRLLGDIVASSMPDTMRPIMVNGLSKSYGKLFKTMASDIKGLKMSKAEMEEMGLALDIVNSMTTMRRYNMADYTPTTGRVDDVTSKVTAFSAMATGNNHWQAAMRTFAGVVTQNRMLDAIVDLSNGKKLNRKEIVNLASHGIDKEMAGRIANQFKAHGEQRKVLKIANATLWNDIEAKTALRTAVRKQVDETIVIPGLDKPLWMSRAGWKTIGQFKSFSFASTQRVLMAGMQQNDANYYTGVVMMTMIGSMVYAYKTMMYGGELSDDPRKWILEGVDRSGITGIGMDVNNILEKVTRGAVGLNALSGGEPMSRYASRNAVGALLGPSFGMAQDMFTTTGAVFSGEFAKSDVHAARRLIPLQNAPYLRHLLDAGEEGLNATLGTE